MYINTFEKYASSIKKVSHFLKQGTDHRERKPTPIDIKIDIVNANGDKFDY